MSPRGSVESARAAAERFFEHESPEASARDRLVMARALGLLFVAGGLIGGLSLALPHTPGIDTLGVGFLCALALFGGVALIYERGRLPGWAFAATCYVASIMIACAIYFSGEGDSPYALYFVLVAMFAAYFLSAWQVLWQICFIGAIYPIVVSILGNGNLSEQRWLLTIWTLIVVGAFIAILRRRMDGLVERLSDAASTDPLTGLLNRRGFKDVFDLELERSRRSGRPCALLVADLDHFKRVNDLLGHPAGDERLKTFARVLDAGKRRIDAVARLGGEEFALLLPETDEHGGYVIAERLRNAVRDAFAPDQLALTVSLGVAAYPNHGGTGERLLEAADQALYVAKELGRDRTALYRPEVTAELLGAKERNELRTDGYLSAMLVLAQAVDERDAGTAMQSEAVGRYAELIAAELGLAPERVERVKLAGLLHDVGKVGVPDPVLRKPGPLNAPEWAEIQRHCELGARLLAGAGLQDLSEWVGAHHERPDGSGYPHGLAGDEIPLEARILAVADAYEAMVGDRDYRLALGPEGARAELEAGAGTQFDPEVVDAFLRCLDRSERVLGRGRRSRGS